MAFTAPLVKVKSSMLHTPPFAVRAIPAFSKAVFPSKARYTVPEDKLVIISHARMVVVLLSATNAPEVFPTATLSGPEPVLVATNIFGISLWF